MKKFFLWLLIAALFVALTGCKGNQQQLDGTNNTLNTKASQNTTTENKEIENTKNTESQQNPATEATENNNTLNTESQQNPPTEATGSEATEENPYAIREITDERVVITGDKKVFKNTNFALSVPLDWKCLTASGEDDVVYYFQDPVLGNKCHLSVSVTFAVFDRNFTLEQYLEILSYYQKNVVIDSFTKEAIQGYECKKLVYSYTEENTKFVGIWYDNVNEGVLLYDISVRYPVSERDTYEAVFESIINSIRFM